MTKKESESWLEKHHQTLQNAADDAGFALLVADWVEGKTVWDDLALICQCRHQERLRRRFHITHDSNHLPFLIHNTKQTLQEGVLLTAVRMFERHEAKQDTPESRAEYLHQVLDSIPRLPALTNLEQAVPSVETSEDQIAWLTRTRRVAGVEIPTKLTEFFQHWKSTTMNYAEACDQLRQLVRECAPSAFPAEPARHRNFVPTDATRTEICEGILDAMISPILDYCEGTDVKSRKGEHLLMPRIAEPELRQKVFDCLSGLFCKSAAKAI
ncbi:MAG: hypothetical protein R3C59_10985 [Planctomycetaceae bacterium]